MKEKFPIALIQAEIPADLAHRFENLCNSSLYLSASEFFQHVLTLGLDSVAVELAGDVEGSSLGSVYARGHLDGFTAGIDQFAKRLSDHYPHSDSIVRRIENVARSLKGGDE